jgi:hypothetical protein
LLAALILGLTPQAKCLSPLRGLVWNLPLRSPTGEAGSPLRGSPLIEIREQVLLIVGTSSSQAPKARRNVVLLRLRRPIREKPNI